MLGLLDPLLLCRRSLIDVTKKNAHCVIKKWGDCESPCLTRPFTDAKLAILSGVSVRVKVPKSIAANSGPMWSHATV